MLYCTFHQLAHPWNAARQTCGSAVHSIGGRCALPHLRPARSACGVWRAHAVTGNVRDGQRAGLGVSDAARAVDAARRRSATHTLPRLNGGRALQRSEPCATTCMHACTTHCTAPRASAFANPKAGDFWATGSAHRHERATPQPPGAGTFAQARPVRPPPRSCSSRDRRCRGPPSPAAGWPV